MDTPHFDGDTYVAPLDHSRLSVQFIRVRDLMSDGEWRTLEEISTTVKAPQASVSARLRDLRKKKFGGYVVERERLSKGLFRYRVYGNLHFKT